MSRIGDPFVVGSRAYADALPLRLRIDSAMRNPAPAAILGCPWFGGHDRVDPVSLTPCGLLGLGAREERWTPRGRSRPSFAAKLCAAIRERPFDPDMSTRVRERGPGAGRPSSRAAPPDGNGCDARDGGRRARGRG